MLLLHHLQHRVPFEGLNLYNNNENLFNEVTIGIDKGKTSITIDPVVYMFVFLKLET